MTQAAAITGSEEEVRLASRDLGGRLYQTDLSLPTIHCGGCIQRIEKALGAIPAVEQARVNLSTKRVAIKWRDLGAPPPFMAKLAELGYDAHFFTPEATRKDPVLSELIRALAVAGFASMNIMLFSVSVWSGADAASRDLFHWISAAIALPTLIYAGRIFYRSAWGALRHGRTNMDVPISIGITLAFLISLYDTAQGNQHAYFDASTSLIFFLLIGRTLDHMMRERARNAVTGLARLAARGAWIARDGGKAEYLPVDDIRPGMTILLAAGDRVPVDGVVAKGRSDLDCSLATGESAPQPVSVGSKLQAGTLNLTGPISMTATAAARDSFLAEMMRLMEAAEAGRSGYRRLADRASALYAPVVHTAAFLTFLGWLIAAGDLHQAVTIAVAVLIITCPCALGLAVPMVQVVAARRLFEQGIMVKDGSAMERLSEIDSVVFDKTGTLTLGRLRLRNGDQLEPQALAIAAALAGHSRHPHSAAIAQHAAETGVTALPLDQVAEHAGLGMEAVMDGHCYRLGRAEWALGTASEESPGTVLARDGALLARFAFDDIIRPGAQEALQTLGARGLEIEILSGDAATPVADLATRLGVRRWAAGVLPGDKADRLRALTAAGMKPLMVGDGLNDAPALAAAHVSMAPATAADVGRNAADFVFLRDDLGAVPFAHDISSEARRLIRQNFGIAVVYNAIALPVAVAGFVTPLIAALAMSLSSILVVGNALRLRAGLQGRLRANGPAVSARLEAAE